MLAVGFIQEAHYPDWLFKMVLVNKPNGKWRMYIDFMDLNKACLKDSFPLPHINLLVDSTADHCMLSFMDADSRYNQIRMEATRKRRHSSLIEGYTATLPCRSV